MEEKEGRRGRRNRDTKRGAGICFGHRPGLGALVQPGRGVLVRAGRLREAGSVPPTTARSHEQVLPQEPGSSRPVRDQWKEGEERNPELPLRHHRPPAGKIARRGPVPRRRPVRATSLSGGSHSPTITGNRRIKPTASSTLALTAFLFLPTLSPPALACTWKSTSAGPKSPSAPTISLSFGLRGGSGK